MMDEPQYIGTLRTHSKEPIYTEDHDGLLISHFTLTSDLMEWDEVIAWMVATIEKWNPVLEPDDWLMNGGIRMGKIGGLERWR